MDIRLNYKGELLPDQEVAIYRITQKALANIHKHAAANRIKVALQSGPAGTFLTIEDNGRGFVPGRQKKGHGLTNMADRARQSGGKLQIHSAPDQGTTIKVSFPK